jgi:hypothetical protein
MLPRQRSVCRRQRPGNPRRYRHGTWRV